MLTLRRLGLLAAALVAVLALAAGPALATEGGGGGAGAGGGDGPAKIQLPESAHDRVGLVLLGLSGVAVVVAGANAIQQLRGRRPHATGEWRWR